MLATNSYPRRTMSDLERLAAEVTVRRELLGTRGSTARYDQLLTDSEARMPPEGMAPPAPPSARSTLFAVLSVLMLVAIGALLWVVVEARAAGIAVVVVGLAIGVRAVRRFFADRAIQRDTATLASGLLSAADRVERGAMARVKSGEREEARAALELAAERLRTLAPSSGRPQEVMDRARALRQAAERL
jgi:hypothetical protein